MKRALPVVILRNEPKRLAHAVDEDFNKMKVAFVPHIKTFVAHHELFRDEKEVGVTFAQKGVSSIIAILETPSRKLVLKIPRSKTFSAGEGQFLKVWEEAGVAVPHVVEMGGLHDFPYTLMDYIDAPTLADIYSKEALVSKRVYAEMGRTLRLMHTPEVRGYGFFVDGKPEFETAEAWLEGEDMRIRLDYIRVHGLLGPLQELLPDMLDVIKQWSKQESSSYCHDDFGPNNIFATEPITIFDANPKYNNRYYELGRVLFADITDGDAGDAGTQFLGGYFGGEAYTEKVLYACTFLACCMKFPYWHQTNRDEKIETAKKYLLQNIF